MAKYFSIRELTRSGVATKRHINNTPPPEVVETLSELADKLLDPLREAWGSPITVNSGYRSPALNKAVGGSPSSQHLRGEAADITAGSPESNRRLFGMAAAGGFDFDQLIDEHNYSWIHISYREGANRRKILHL